MLNAAVLLHIILLSAELPDVAALLLTAILTWTVSGYWMFLMILHPQL
jgi:hypothetical protein